MKGMGNLALLLLVLTATAVKAEEELVTLYGSLRPEMIIRAPEEGDVARLMDDGYSRIGVKGETELGDGLRGFYKYERRVSANDGEDDGAVRGDNNELRQVYAGIGGRFGTFSIGRHYGLYYDYIDDELDRHRSHYSDAIVFGDLFVSNALVYRSPEFGGGDFGLLVELNDVDDQGGAIDERVEVAGSLRRGGAALHVGYVHVPDHDGLLGLAASYRLERVNFAGVLQQIERTGADAESLYSLAIDFDLTARNRLRAALTATRGDAGDVDYVLFGGEHRFAPQFLAFAEFFHRASEVVRPDDESAMAAGVRFDFD
ncbi:MAG: porin [Gemmatimonadetes bacterium]|jgi:predicted porin|nr:porin [Gemmatimonadota bacterium]